MKTTIIPPEDVRVLKLVLKRGLYVAVGLALVLTMAVVAIEFDLNRGGEYCNQRTARLLFLSAENCYVDFLGLARNTLRYSVVHMIFSIAFVAGISHIGVFLYLVREREHLGGPRSKG